MLLSPEAGVPPPRPPNSRRPQRSWNLLTNPVPASSSAPTSPPANAPPPEARRSERSPSMVRRRGDPPPSPGGPCAPETRASGSNASTPSPFGSAPHPSPRTTGRTARSSSPTLEWDGTRERMSFQDASAPSLATPISCGSRRTSSRWRSSISVGCSVRPVRVGHRHPLRSQDRADGLTGFRKSPFIRTGDQKSDFVLAIGGLISVRRRRRQRPRTVKQLAVRRLAAGTADPSETGGPAGTPLPEGASGRAAVP